MIKRILARFKKLSYEQIARNKNIDFARNIGVKVGENCRFYSTFFSTEPYLIEVGDNVTIADNVFFVTHDGGVWVLRNLYKMYKNINIVGKIKIGNNVFIGMNSTILYGVTIGNNVIIAAGSLVTKSFPDNVVIGGVPARILKSIDEYAVKNEKFFLETKNLSNHERMVFLKDPKNSKKILTNR